VNLVLDGRHEKEGAAKVSLQLEDVPLETAVRLLAEMAGLKALRLNNTMFVTTKDIAAELRQAPAWNGQGQPAQPTPPGGVLVPPAGIPAPPPTVISNPVPAPGVPPAVGDPPPDKTSDPAKPVRPATPTLRAARSAPDGGGTIGTRFKYDLACWRAISTPVPAAAAGACRAVTKQPAAVTVALRRRRCLPSGPPLGHCRPGVPGYR